MPFAYLTVLRSPRRSKLRPASSTSGDDECVLPPQVEVASSEASDTNGADDAEIPATSLEGEVDIMRPGRPHLEVQPGQVAEHILSVQPNSDLNHDVDAGADMGQNKQLRGNAIDVIQLDETSPVAIKENSSQAQAFAKSGRGMRAGAGSKRRSTIVEQRKGSKRLKLPTRHHHMRQRLSSESATQAEATHLPDSASSEAQVIAAMSSVAPRVSSTESRICECMGPCDHIVSVWMDDPEIVRTSQKQALAGYRQPRQELLSYLNLIASIGTIEVRQSFAVGVMQLMRSASFSFIVPASPNHLVNIEDADAMQCFWRAAYRTQVHASLVSFGVIIHRRSLATLRNCYFKAMKAIKSTMKRKRVPGYTKTAIARGILLDTVFPGSDKVVSDLLCLPRLLLK
jgi:hypothetical protein